MMVGESMTTDNKNQKWGDLWGKNALTQTSKHCSFLNVFVELCFAEHTDQCRAFISYKRIFGSESNTQEKNVGVWPDLSGRREKKVSKFNLAGDQINFY